MFYVCLCDMLFQDACRQPQSGQVLEIAEIREENYCVGEGWGFCQKPHPSFQMVPVLMMLSDL